MLNTHDNEMANYEGDLKEKTIFENQFIYTKEYYKEYYQYTCFKRPIMLAINIILSINFIISLLSIMFPQLNALDANMAGANITTVLIIICLQIYVYFKSKKRAYKKSFELNEGKPRILKILINEKGISIFLNSEKNISVEFKDMEKIIETKNYYILISKAKSVIALKKDGFIVGNPDEFKQFLRKQKITNKK